MSDDGVAQDPAQDGVAQDPAQDGVVLVERRDGVLVITLNRPEAKNALERARSPAAVAAAADELDASDDLRVGVLTGAGGTFSAGHGPQGVPPRRAPDRSRAAACAASRQTPPRKPLIGAVEGWALAGGFELLLACDLVVAAETARLGVPEVTRSLVAIGGAALAAAPADAARHRHGAAADRGAGDRGPRGARWAWSTASRPRAGARRPRWSWPRPIAANGPLAVAATKAVARGSRRLALGRGLGAAGASSPTPVFTSEDAREGSTAFAEKRPPVWRGR